eukprot:6464915-Amphidinium_carterae.1
MMLLGKEYCAICVVLMFKGLEQKAIVLAHGLLLCLGRPFLVCSHLRPDDDDRDDQGMSVIGAVADSLPPPPSAEDHHQWALDLWVQLARHLKPQDHN